jgi:outer membrane protein assembly factor BamE (lipoprotein component of BamABCDE complex)
MRGSNPVGQNSCQNRSTFLFHHPIGFRMVKQILSPSVAILGLLLLVSGCASLTGAEYARNVEKLQNGMTPSQILSLLGTPDSVYRKGGVDKWVYEFRKQSKGSRNIAVEFRGGKVAKHGEMSGREIAAAEDHRESGVCTRLIAPREFRFEPLCAD